jgi:hypothetical protein
MALPLIRIYFIDEILRMFTLNAERWNIRSHAVDCRLFLGQVEPQTFEESHWLMGTSTLSFSFLV